MGDDMRVDASRVSGFRPPLEHVGGNNFRLPNGKIYTVTHYGDQPIKAGKPLTQQQIQFIQNLGKNNFEAMAKALAKVDRSFTMQVGSQSKTIPIHFTKAHLPDISAGKPSTAQSDAANKLHDWSQRQAAAQRQTQVMAGKPRATREVLRHDLDELRELGSKAKEIRDQILMEFQGKGDISKITGMRNRLTSVLNNIRSRLIAFNEDTGKLAGQRKLNDVPLQTAFDNRLSEFNELAAQNAAFGKRIGK